VGLAIAAMEQIAPVARRVYVMSSLPSLVRGALVAALIALAAPVAIAAPAPLAATPAADCRNTATTTLEMNVCASAERKRADAELNVVYRQLLARVTRSQKNQLIRAERAWVAFRDAHCAFASSFSLGGSLHPVQLTFCLADVTAQRVEALRGALEQASL
jgi:uncharacterized protein YecT (DUF1311 family)